jgi:hypothetical protein
VGRDHLSWSVVKRAAPHRAAVAAAARLYGAPRGLVRWGDWGQACVMAFSYRDPRTSELVTGEQAVRVQRPAEWKPWRGPGVPRSGLLRHPVVIGVGR